MFDINAPGRSHQLTIRFECFSRAFAPDKGFPLCCWGPLTFLPDAGWNAAKGALLEVSFSLLPISVLSKTIFLGVSVCLAFFITTAAHGEVGAFRFVHGCSAAVADVSASGAPKDRRDDRGITPGSPAASASAAISRRRLTSSSTSSVEETQQLALSRGLPMKILLWSRTYLSLHIEEHAEGQQSLLGDHQADCSEPYCRV